MIEFWDTSVVVPLYVEELGTTTLQSILPTLAKVAIWRGTPVEVASALARRTRETSEPHELSKLVNARLIAEAAFRGDGFTFVHPSEPIFNAAAGLLYRHRLRAADALQLAAALDLRRDLPTLRFRCADARLNDAATAEGLPLA